MAAACVILTIIHQQGDQIIGLVVKVSASGAEDRILLVMGFIRVESYQ